MIDYKAQGKRNKAMGADFERRTRRDLENMGWKTTKWGQNVVDDVCVPAKQGRFRSLTTGFPDFIAYKRINGVWEVVFIECKCNGYLDREEKAKAQWYLDNGYCDRFLISWKYKENGKVRVKYKDFLDYIGKKGVKSNGN